ncbi:MAG: HTH domain-containing protein [Planctomycetes bacterium]|nr:HTH domain-containing protein [Planctomycetota bacterium]
MKKTELRDQLRKAGVPFKAKATKAELQQLLSKADGQTKPTTKKNKAGAKAVLREKFTQHGVVTVGQIDKIAERLNVTRATVLTAISDLKNAKYAGSLGALAIEKDGDSYRLAK